MNTQPPTADPQSNNMMIKPLLSGLYSAALDRYVIGNLDLNSNFWLGASTSFGMALTPYVSPYFVSTDYQDSTDYTQGTTFSQRATEVGLTTAGAFITNKYILSNDYNPNIAARIGCLIVSDILATYSVDYMNNNKLTFLGSK